MNTAVASNEFTRFLKFFIDELKPRGKWLTPFNVISIPVIILGLIILYFRFTRGLGYVTNLSQQFPWGFWIGFDVITGVALAGGAYVICFVVIVSTGSMVTKSCLFLWVEKPWKNVASMMWSSR